MQACSNQAADMEYVMSVFPGCEATKRHHYPDFGRLPCLRRPGRQAPCPPIQVSLNQLTASSGRTSSCRRFAFVSSAECSSWIFARALAWVLHVGPSSTCAGSSRHRGAWHGCCSCHARMSQPAISDCDSGTWQKVPMEESEHELELFLQAYSG